MISGNGFLINASKRRLYDHSFVIILSFICSSAMAETEQGKVQAGGACAQAGGPHRVPSTVRGPVAHPFLLDKELPLNQARALLMGS